MAFQRPPLAVEFEMVEDQRSFTVQLHARGFRSWGGMRWQARPHTFTHSLQFAAPREALRDALEVEARKMRADYIRAMRALQSTRWGRHL